MFRHEYSEKLCFVIVAQRFSTLELQCNPEESANADNIRSFRDGPEPGEESKGIINYYSLSPHKITISLPY